MQTNIASKPISQGVCEDISESAIEKGFTKF